MVIISADPWEDRSSSKPEQSRNTESEQIEKTLFGFQDLASDYYQVIQYITRVAGIWPEFSVGLVSTSRRQISTFHDISKIEIDDDDSWKFPVNLYPRYYDNVVDLEYVEFSGQ